MHKYRVVAPGGIEYDGMHYDFGALVYMSETEAAPYLAECSIMETANGDPTKPGPLPEEGRLDG